MPMDALPQVLGLKAQKRSDLTEEDIQLLWDFCSSTIAETSTGIGHFTINAPLLDPRFKPKFDASWKRLHSLSEETRVAKPSLKRSAAAVSSSAEQANKKPKSDQNWHPRAHKTAREKRLLPEGYRLQAPSGIIRPASAQGRYAEIYKGHERLMRHLVCTELKQLGDTRHEPKVVSQTVTQVYTKQTLCSRSALVDGCRKGSCTRRHDLTFMLFAYTAALLKHSRDQNNVPIRSERGNAVNDVAVDALPLAVCLSWALTVFKDKPDCTSPKCIKSLFEGQKLVQKRTQANSVEPISKRCHSLWLLEEHCLATAKRSISSGEMDADQRKLMIEHLGFTLPQQQDRPAGTKAESTEPDDSADPAPSVPAEAVTADLAEAKIEAEDAVSVKVEDGLGKVEEAGTGVDVRVKVEDEG